MLLWADLWGRGEGISSKVKSSFSDWCGFVGLEDCGEAGLGYCGESSLSVDGFVGCRGVVCLALFGFIEVVVSGWEEGIDVCRRFE